MYPRGAEDVEKRSTQAALSSAGVCPGSCLERMTLGCKRLVQHKSALRLRYRSSRARVAVKLCAWMLHHSQAVGMNRLVRRSQKRQIRS